MAEHKGLPVPGYVPQSDEKIGFVTRNKETEERILRILDAMKSDGSKFDQRWVAVARTHFEEGFMAMNRAIFQPQRVALPEDDQ